MGKNGNLDALLDELESDFDEMNFDTDFDKENFNGKVKRLVKTIRQDNGVIKHVGNIAGKDTITSLITQSKGDANILVTRLTNNIAGVALPFVIFGLNDRNSNYASTLSGFIPTGVVLTSVTTTSTGDIDFTYTSGANVDIVRVSFQGVTNYNTFLNGMNQNWFTSKYILYTISNELIQTQFNQMLNFGNLTNLGAKSANQLLLNSRKMTWDYLKDRINVLMAEQRIDADFSFVQNIVDDGGAGGFQIGFNIFMNTKDLRSK
jgi:hypothetical protein